MVHFPTYAIELLPRGAFAVVNDERTPPSEWIQNLEQMPQTLPMHQVLSCLKYIYLVFCFCSVLAPLSFRFRIIVQF